MFEGNFASVQRLARQNRRRPGVDGVRIGGVFTGTRRSVDDSGEFVLGNRGATAVQLVAKNRAADVRQMNANLMRPPGFRKAANRRKAAEPFVDFEERLRRFRFRIIRRDRHSLAEFRVMADRLIDDVAVDVRDAENDREILLLNPLFFEERGEVRVSDIVFRNDYCAARVAVESVNDSRAGRAAVRTQLPGEAVRERADERSRPMSPRRVNDHIRRLVNDRHIVVFEQHVERNILRNRRLARRFDEAERNDGTGFQPEGRFPVFPVDGDAVRRLNRFAEQDAAVLRELRGEEKVEPPTGLGVGNDAGRDVARFFVGRRPKFDVGGRLQFVERFEFVERFHFRTFGVGHKAFSQNGLKFRVKRRVPKNIDGRSDAVRFPDAPLPTGRRD